MLGKLIKYDLKYGSKIFITLHAIFVVAVILGRFLFLDKIDFFGNKNTVLTFITLFVTIFILLYSSLSLGVSFLIAFRFYRNLFASEGYLSWTLPATPTQHLWSKIISGTIWLILNLVITALSIILLVSGDNVTSAYAHIAPDFIKGFGMDPVLYGWYIFVFSLFCSMGGVILIYLSIALGHLFPSHRVLASIIMYFIVTAIIEIFVFIIMFSTNTYPMATDFLTHSGGSMSTYLFTIFKITAIFSTFMSVIEYFIIRYIMHRKINLI